MTGTVNQLDLDLKSRLRQYLPVLFEFLDVEDFEPEQWDKLTANFTDRFLKRKAEYEANNNHLVVERDIYGVIIGKLKGERSATLFLDFIRKALEELAARLTADEKKLVKKTLFGFLISHDFMFANYLGELLVLNAITKSNSFILKSVESSIAGDLTADFLFEKADGSGNELIEVVNLHIDESHTDLVKHLTKKYRRKLANKRGGHAAYNKFTLIPVIWAPFSDLQRIYEIYQNGDIQKIPYVLEPVAYSCTTMTDGGIIYKFGTISTLLDRSLNK
jgi:hypothetical protein